MPHPADLCICGHSREDHFEHECSIVGENSVIYRRGLGRGIDCTCKQFVEGGHAVNIFEALKALLSYLPDRNDALNYAATNEGRASSFQVAAIQAREVFQRAVNS